MKFESEEERKAISDLCDIAFQSWDRESYMIGEWPELESALKLISPMVNPDFDVEEYFS